MRYYFFCILSVSVTILYSADKKRILQKRIPKNSPSGSPRPRFKSGEFNLYNQMDPKKPLNLSFLSDSQATQLNNLADSLAGLSPSEEKVLDEVIEYHESPALSAREESLQQSRSATLERGSQTPDKFGKHSRRPPKGKSQSNLRKLLVRKKEEEDPVKLLASPDFSKECNRIAQCIIYGDLTHNNKHWDKAATIQALAEQEQGSSICLARMKRMLNRRGVLFGGVPADGPLKEELFLPEDYKIIADDLYNLTEKKDMILFDTIEKIFQHGVEKYIQVAKEAKMLYRITCAIATLTAEKNVEITKNMGKVAYSRTFTRDLQLLKSNLQLLCKKNKKSTEDEAKRYAKMLRATKALLESDHMSLIRYMESPPVCYLDLIKHLTSVHYNIAVCLVEKSELTSRIRSMYELLEHIKEYKGKRIENEVTPATIVHLDEYRKIIEGFENKDDVKPFSLTPPKLKEKKDEQCDDHIIILPRELPPSSSSSSSSSSLRFSSPSSSSSSSSSNLT